jgi:hypothetical protein
VGVDLEKILKFITQNLPEFFEVLVATLIHPVARFQLASSTIFPSPSGIVTKGIRPEGATWLDPKLFAFAAVSIVIGTMINDLIPGRRKGPDLFANVIVLLTLWFFCSTGLHILCKFRKRSQG